MSRKFRIVLEEVKDDDGITAKDSEIIRNVLKESQIETGIQLAWAYAMLDAGITRKDIKNS